VKEGGTIYGDVASRAQLPFCGNIPPGSITRLISFWKTHEEGRVVRVVGSKSIDTATVTRRDPRKLVVSCTWGGGVVRAVAEFGLSSGTLLVLSGIVRLNFAKDWKKDILE